MQIRLTLRDSHCQFIYLFESHFIKNSINLLATKRFEFFIFYMALIDLSCQNNLWYNIHIHPIFMAFVAAIVILFHQVYLQKQNRVYRKSFRIPQAKPEHIVINNKN